MTCTTAPCRQWGSSSWAAWPAWTDIGHPSPGTWPTRSPLVMPATATSASCSASNSPPRGWWRPSCPTLPPFTPTRRFSWTSTGSERPSSPRGSAPTTPTGYGSRPLTPWASPAPRTGPARSSRACTSAASTSYASASPRSCSAWARTPPSWPNRSPATTTPHPQAPEHGRAGIKTMPDGGCRSCFLGHHVRGPAVAVKDLYLSASLSTRDPGQQCEVKGREVQVLEFRRGPWPWEVPVHRPDEPLALVVLQRQRMLPLLGDLVRPARSLRPEQLENVGFLDQLGEPLMPILSGPRGHLVHEHIDPQRSVGLGDRLHDVVVFGRVGGEDASEEPGRRGCHALGALLALTDAAHADR